MDWIAWLRMGRPCPGAVSVREKGTYTFEQGAEMIERLREAFGDPQTIAAADLGSGANETAVGEQVLRIPWRRLVSVEAHLPSVRKLHARAAAAGRHDILHGRIEALFAEFRPGELDLALLIDVLEHFSRRQALHLLRRIERFFALGVVVFLPLGRVEQGPLEGNELQRHRSSWWARDLAGLGYTVDLYEAFHGQLDPPADAAWAMKRWG